MKDYSVIGPMKLHFGAARELGWTNEMIKEAAIQMGDLSRSFTRKVGICCIHCGSLQPRGRDCEPKNSELSDRARGQLGRELLKIARRLGFTNQADSDARDEVYTLAKKLLK